MPAPSPEKAQPHWAPCAFTGMHLQSHWASCAFTGMYSHTNPQSRFPHNLSPLSWVLCFYASYLTRDSTTQRVCSPGAGFNPPEFWSPCGLPVSCCLTTSVLWSRSTGCPAACLCVHLHGLGGLTWSSLAQDLHVSGRHESGICTVPFPGPWRARRLDSAV